MSEVIPRNYRNIIEDTRRRVVFRCDYYTIRVTTSYMRKAKSLPPILAIRLPPDQRFALGRAAQADDRPVSTLARKIITDWLRENELLDEKKDGTSGHGRRTRLGETVA
jgi:hypothetical protein